MSRSQGSHSRPVKYNIGASSNAAQRNREPILAQLRTLLAPLKSVLELGSGTGVHARYFAERLPHLSWQPSEHPERLQPLLELAGPPNLLPALAVDITAARWPKGHYDAIFMANVLHFIPAEGIPAVLRRIAKKLPESGLLIVYGPFNRAGEFTGPGNRDFDHQLRKMDVRFGLRDVHELRLAGEHARLAVYATIAMPHDNLLLVWERLAELR